MVNPPPLRRVRMRTPGSRWRDPDFLVYFMFGAAFLALLTLITGGSETYVYISAQTDPASRIGLCGLITSDYCVQIEEVEVVGSKGDQVTLRPVDGTNDIVVTRIGGAEASAFARQDTVWLEDYQGDHIAVSDRKTGALMKLEAYPEPPLRFWVPEDVIGVISLVVWIGLFWWRNQLFKTLTLKSAQ